MLKEKIMQVWKGEEGGREVYGARKTWLELNRQGIVVARCTVERLMRDLGIHGARGRRKRPRTTVPGDPAGMPQDLRVPEISSTALTSRVALWLSRP